MSTIRQINIVLSLDESGKVADFEILQEKLEQLSAGSLSKESSCPTCQSSLQITIVPGSRSESPETCRVEEPSDIVEDSFPQDDEKPVFPKKKRKKRDDKSRCRYCGKLMESQDSAKLHEVCCRAKFQQDLKCDLCDKSFSILGTLKVHVLRVHSQKSFTCHLCGSSFCRSSELDEHLIRHENPKPFTCHHCGEQYAVKNSLRDHLKTYHTTSFGGFFCSLCPNGKKYPTQHKLTEHHERVHSGNDRYACNQCTRRFKYPESLRNHVSRHHTPPEQMKWFPCDRCNFRGPTVKALEKHKMVHLGDADKPFHCSYCSKGFGRRYEWNRHEMIHREEKPYQCGICGHLCRTNYLVQKHMRVHQEGRAYSCPVCEKSYRDRDSFKKHVKLHKTQTDEAVQIEIPPHPSFDVPTFDSQEPQVVVHKVMI